MVYLYCYYKHKCNRKYFISSFKFMIKTSKLYVEFICEGAHRPKLYFHMAFTLQSTQIQNAH